MECVYRDGVYSDNYVAIRAAQQALGGDGLVMIRVAKGPIQEILYQMTGLERFAIDYYERRECIDSLYDVMVGRYDELYELAAGAPQLTGFLDTACGAALSLAAPVLVVSFLVSVSLALLARAAPQANILLVGFPLKLGIGLAALAFFTPLMGWAIYRLAVRVAPEVGAFAGGG